MPTPRVFKSIISASCVVALILGFAATVQAASVHTGILPRYDLGDQIQHSEYYHLSQASADIDEQNCLQAMPHLNEAAEIEPGSVFVHANLGHCYMQMAMASTSPNQAQVFLKKSEEAYMRIQYVAPELTSTYFKLGRIAILQEDMKKAIDYYLMGLEYEPDNAALMFNAARAYDQIEDYENAKGYYYRTLAIDPSFVYAYNNLGLIFEAEGNLVQAEKQYTQALQRDVNYAYARLNLGNLYAQTNRVEEALVEYQTVLGMQPDNAWAHLYMGNAYFSIELYDKALEHYTHASDQNPQYEATYYLMAITLSRLQKLDEAMQISEIYLEMAPEGEYAKQVRDLMLTLQLHQAGVFFLKGQTTTAAPSPTSVK